MYLKLVGLYGLDDCVAWFRQLGLCYDFVNDKKYASELTPEYAERIISSKDYYIKQYNAKDLVIDS